MGRISTCKHSHNEVYIPHRVVENPQPTAIRLLARSYRNRTSFPGTICKASWVVVVIAALPLKPPGVAESLEPPQPIASSCVCGTAVLEKQQPCVNIVALALSFSLFPAKGSRLAKQRVEREN